MKSRIIFKSFFFLILILFLIFIPISSFSPFAIASEVNEPMLTTDILNVQLGDFQDNTPGDGSGKLDYITGGFDLLEFENLGIYSVNEETNTIIYRAKVKWGYEINAWTSTLFRSIYPEIDIENIEKHTYLSIQWWKHIGLCQLPVGEYQKDKDSYKIEYYDIDYGNVYYQHDYHGGIPVTIGIDEGLAYSGEISIGGQTFTVPELTSDILYTKIVDMRGGECGSYLDRYSDEGLDRDEITVHIEVPDGTWSSDTRELADWFNDEGIGKISDISNATLSVQQSLYDLSYDGFNLHDSGTDNEFTFNLPVHIQPEVTKLRQFFDVKRGGFHWYTCCGEFRRGPWSVDERVQRDISVSVQNVFVHYDLEMESDLFMTCQFTGELSESFLDDPNLVISDMIWDISIWGDESVYVHLPKEKSWWEDLLWIIIIIVIISIGGYIGYKVFKIYTDRYKKPVQQYRNY